MTARWNHYHAGRFPLFFVVGVTARWNHYHAGRSPLFFVGQSIEDRAAKIRMTKPERQFFGLSSV